MINTARQLMELLAGRYTRDHYALLPEVELAVGWSGENAPPNRRRIDAMAVSFWRSDLFAVTGFELKVNRADWLRELKQPNKAGIFMPYCTKFYLVAPEGVAKKEELPTGWGFLEARVDGLGVTRNAARNKTPRDIPRALWVDLLRQALKVSPMGGEYERGVREGIARQRVDDVNAYSKIARERQIIDNERFRVEMEAKHGPSFSRENLGLKPFKEPKT